MSAVRYLELPITLGSLIIRHGVLTSCADLLPIDYRPTLAAAYSALHTLIILIDEVTLSAGLTVIMRVTSPARAV